MKKHAIYTAICLACVPLSSQADVRFNGFASIIGGQTLDNEDQLYGYNNELSFKEESMFALQVTADLQDRLSATAQIVAKGEDDFNAEFEWAYLSYQATDNIKINLGKMRIPAYLYSDYLDVGYAYRWIRPPQEVYSLQFSTYEGISLLHTSTLGDWDSTLQLLYGGFSGELRVTGTGVDSRLDDLYGFNWTMNRDWFTARAAYLVASTSIDITPVTPLIQLVGALNAYGLSQQGNALLMYEEDGTFAEVGIAVDYNNFLLDAEYVEVEVKNSFMAPQSQYYVSVGYRFNDWTVHATYEDNDDKHDAKRFNTVPTTVTLGGNVIPVSTNPADPNAPLLRDLYNGALASMASKSNVYSVGLRYDFHPSAALKVQYSQRKDKLTDQNVEVLAFGVDLVF